VQRGVLGVGEATTGLVELQRGDTEVHEYAGHAVRGVRADHLVDVVVHRVDGGESCAVPSQPAAGELDRLRVAVDAEHLQLREAAQGEVAVPTHPERRVEQHGTRTFEGRGEE